MNDGFFRRESGRLRVLVALAALLQIGLLVLLIVVLLDIRRFIGDAIPLMGRANRWLARREESG